MNQFDQTVGGGITSLLAQNQEVMGEPGGAFNFAPKNEPVLKMADGGMTFSDDQLAQNIRDAIAQGKSFSDITAGLTQSGVSPTQLNAVIGQLARTSSFTPQTSVGIPGTGGSFWTFVRDALKEGATTLAPMIAAPYLGQIGSALGASSAYAPALGGAVVGGATSALSGKEGSDILKGAALGALGGAGGDLAKTLGREAGAFAGDLFTNETASSYATQLAKGAVEGGIKALPGAIATGDINRALTGALLGGATNVGQYALGDSDLPITKQQMEAGVNLARAVSSGNITSAANAAATLINNPDITVATKAATLLRAVNSGNPAAILAATQGLSNAVNRSSIATKTAEAPGGAFETSAIVEPGDMGGTTVPGEAGEDYIDPNSVLVTGQTEPVDLISLLDTDTGTATLPRNADQTVSVTGTMLPVEGLSDVGDLLSVLEDPNTVKVTDSTIKPVDEGVEDITDQRVDLTKKYIPRRVDGGEGVGDITDQRVDITKKYIPRRVEGGEGGIETGGEKVEDITDQRVDVTDKKYIPRRVDGGEGVAATTPATTTTTTTPTTTSTPTTTTTVKPITTTTTTYETPTYTPMQEAAPAQPFRPGVVTDAYEVLFGPGAPSLMGFTKAERAKQMLARGQEEGENQPQTAYDHLMSMADRDPIGTVNQLMKIIEGD